MNIGLPSPRFDPPVQFKGWHASRDQRGLIMSSPLALVSAGAVLLAGVAFFVTAPAKHPDIRLAAAEQVVEPQTVLNPAVPVPLFKRADTYVVVFNNTSIKGLAGATSDRLAGAGWNVVGSDNWYGTIPSSTVYYPERLKEQAQLLAKDLGLERLKPAEDPMQLDRLTVILTADFGR